MPTDPKPPFESAELVPQDERQQLSAPVEQQISVGSMLQAALKGGVTKDNVDVMEKLMNLYERDQARQAERSFAQSFAALQAEMPKIKAVKPVPDRDGGVKYHFAPYEEIHDKLQPFLLKHGFSVAFSQSYGEGTVTQTCILRHRDGHKQENSFSCRIGKGPPGASESQADGAAGTYAKRHAYCNAFNIVIDTDTDGKNPDMRDIGSPITRDQVQYLREQVKETGSDPAKFLALAGAKTFEEIPTGSYDVLVRALSAKRRPA